MRNDEGENINPESIQRKARLSLAGIAGGVKEGATAIGRRNVNERLNSASQGCVKEGKRDYAKRCSDQRQRHQR